jgi:hypothetical protein
MSTWQKKQAKAANFAMERELAESGNNFNENLVAADVRDAAMGKGDEELYDKKMSKEEKKAIAKAKRDAKKKVRHRCYFIIRALLRMCRNLLIRHWFWGYI